MKVEIIKDQADQDTFEDWRNEDYMNKMEFSPLVMFVVIPTIVQAACFTVAMKMKDEMKNPGVSFMTIDKCKFRKPVTPGDVLHLKVKRLNKVKNVYKFEGQCLVNDAIYAQCIFSAMIHDVPSTS